MPKLADVLDQIESKATEVRSIFDEIDAKGGEDDADARRKVVELNKEIEDLEKRALDLKGQDAIREANDRRITEMRTPAEGARPVFPGGKSQREELTTAVKSLGLHVVDHPEFKKWIQSWPNGVIPESAKGIRSPAIPFPDALAKTLVTGTSSTSGGAFVVNEQSGIADLLGRRELTVLDLVSKRTTTSDTIEAVRQTARGNAAAPVAEATATAGSSGVKPEGSMTFERITVPVRTIAEWVPVTKRALSDAGQLRGIIDQELRDDLMEEVEDQIITGDGTGENFEGIDAVSGTQDQAWSTNILTTTRKARTLVRTVGRRTPNGYVLNPTDWETIDLLQDNEARYFFGGPSQLGTPRLWGLSVVENEAQPVGWGWVADWKRAILWDREQATISVSDSHSDFFIRNLVAILAELRAAFVVIQPNAFVEMDLTA